MSKVAQSDLEAFGGEVRRARITRGWTLDQLGSKALQRDGAKGYLSQIEQGKRQISPRTAGRLKTTLDLPDTLLDPWLGQSDTEEDEITPEDRDAEKLMILAQGDETAPPTAEALLVSLAYEFAQGSHRDLFTAFNGLRAALRAAADIKARGQMPQNTGDQLQAVMQRVGELNDQGLRDEAAGELDAAMERLDAEREAIFNLQLSQDRIQDKPLAAAKRLVRHIRQSAPPGGVFRAVHDLLWEWHKRGERDGTPFDLHVALELARMNYDRAKKPNVGVALDGLGLCHLKIGQRSAGEKRLEIAARAFAEAAKIEVRAGRKRGWATSQSNLGSALQELGKRRSDPGLLRQALEAYEKALDVLGCVDELTQVSV